MMRSIREWLRRQDVSNRAVDPFPLVSCIMPTYNRRAFVAQAISYFRRQEYPSKELIVVDDGSERVRDLVATDPRIRYIGLRTRTSVGEKRNIAISESSGDIIAHWEDDDWYDETRLSYQIGPLLSGIADITALRMSFMYDLLSDFMWFVDDDLFKLMFVGGIHTGTIVYRKDLWGLGAAFPPVDLAEDVAFIRHRIVQGAKLLPLANDARFSSLSPMDFDGQLALLEEVARRCGGVLYPPLRPTCIYVRHARNTWRFVCGEHVNSHAWHKMAPAELLPAGDLACYRTIAAEAGLARR